MPATLIVSNLDVIQKKLAESGPAVNTAMRTGLREAADPVAKIAETYSLTKIRRMRYGNPKQMPAWAVTRIGITRKAVYIVPKEKGLRDPRNPHSRGAQVHGGGLTPIMMTKAFEPALQAGEPIVRERVMSLLGEVTRAF